MIFTSGERLDAQLGLPRHGKSHLPLVRCIPTSHSELRKDLVLQASSLWALMLQSLQSHYRGIYTALWWERPPRYLRSTLFGTAESRVFTGSVSWDQPEIRSFRR